MAKAEFGAGAVTRTEELEQAIAKADKEINHMVAAIREGGFSSALSEALKETETRQQDLRLRLRQTREQMGSKMNLDAIIHELINRDGGRLSADCWLWKIP